MTVPIRHYQSARAGVEQIAWDPSVVSPVSGEQLVFVANGGLETQDGREHYDIDNGILRLFVAEGEAGPQSSVTSTVQAFYENAPFPNYNEFDSLERFLQRAVEGVFAHLLTRQIPIGARVLEVGCGTGQLSNYLAATCMAHIYGSDMTLASLRLGQAFTAKYAIPGLTFMQMNLFRPCIRPGSMDLVMANGVLHHTADTRRAFLSIAPLVRPGGHILIGLYNRIGRIRTDLRRALYRLLGERVLFLDPYLRSNLSEEKRRAWIRDQYCHPHERKHTMSEVLRWFDEAGFSFISSIPKIHGHFSENERLFELQDSGSEIDRLGTELASIITQGWEGGLFIMIGRRNSATAGTPAPRKHGEKTFGALKQGWHRNRAGFHGEATDQ
jgi:2-polyprenyl-3-methyl-5-hydroxy-6-metoxy-1,4-benzoquinol methylase